MIPTEYQPIIFVIVGISSVIGGYVAFKKLQKADVKALFNGEWHKKKDEFKVEVREIVAEAFTGRAEADAHFRAEALNNYKTVLREALDDHSKDERTYIDSLRDRIVEYHVEAKTAIQDAKRIAVHVSNEYQRIVVRLEQLERELREIRDTLKKMEGT